MKYYTSARPIEPIWDSHQPLLINLVNHRLHLWGDSYLNDAKFRRAKLRKCDLRNTQLPENHGGGWAGWGGVLGGWSQDLGSVVMVWLWVTFPLRVGLLGSLPDLFMAYKVVGDPAIRSPLLTSFTGRISTKVGYGCNHWGTPRLSPQC